MRRAVLWVAMAFALGCSPPAAVDDAAAVARVEFDNLRLNRKIQGIVWHEDGRKSHVAIDGEVYQTGMSVKLSEPGRSAPKVHRISKGEVEFVYRGYKFVVTLGSVDL